MPLITVYFPSDDERPYRKAIIDEKDKKFFFSLGAAGLPDDIKKPKSPQDEKMFEGNPDKGFGEVGSYQWHFNQIHSLKSNNEVVEYLRQLTGKYLNNKGRPDYIKKKALSIIREHLKK